MDYLEYQKKRDKRVLEMYKNNEQISVIQSIFAIDRKLIKRICQEQLSKDINSNSNLTKEQIRKKLQFWDDQDDSNKIPDFNFEPRVMPNGEIIKTSPY